jgi:ATP-dependent RNA helicase DOB1
MDVKTCQEMIQGKAAPLVSTFRLSYYTLLNLMSRAEGHFNVEHVIRNSFHQFQHNKALPSVEEQIRKLEEETSSIDAAGEVR